MTKIYVTKYALTSGISEHDAELLNNGQSASVRSEYCNSYYHLNDFHLTLDSTLNKTEEMRINKLKSLDKQIKKISALKF